jgi:diguanylate cyclase (GGDEF)-like protein
VNRYKVCLADACAESISVLSQELQRHNYEVITARSASEALQVCDDHPIDLVLVDLDLPESDGYEVCRTLKDSRATEEIAVLFSTNGNGEEDIAKGYQLGGVGYLRKPYNLPIVIISLAGALRQRDLQHKVQSQEHLMLDGAYTDPLTGLRNRTYLMERFQEEVEKSHRYEYPISCVLFDLDHVEAMDIELGPASLDDLLAEAAMAIRNFTRGYDILARYDGTLFAALLPHTPLEHAKSYAKKILMDIESTTFSDPCFPTSASLSTGVVTFLGDQTVSAESMLGDAMQELFRAKSARGERLAARSLVAS